MAYEYYEILGVSREVTVTEIKKAFRRKARELHPDVNKEADAEERFKELNEAYDVLSDPRKKSLYDRTGTPEAAQGFGGYQTVDMSDIFGGMGDIFSSFFGGMGGSGWGAQQARRDGRDMGVGIRLTLEDVARGAKKEIVYDRLATCEECDGSGAAEDGTEVECPTCHGSGHVVTVQHTFLGDMQTASVCSECGGTGRTIDNPCTECNGQGRVPDREHLTIEIPLGIRDGQQIRVQDRGEAGIQGAPSGDLIATVRIDPHEYFERDGSNLHTRVNVTVVQAMLGAEVFVVGIMEDEEVPVEIPAGCQPGQALRVKGYGLPIFRGNGERGDLIVHVTVVVPRELSEEEREVASELGAMIGDEVSKTRAPLVS